MNTFFYLYSIVIHNVIPFLTMKVLKTLTFGLIFSLLSFNAQAHDGHKKDIVETAIYGGIFKSFIAAIKAADLIDTLRKKGQFTVFAPTDEAFSKLPTGTFEALLKPENKKRLTDILKYHVIKARIPTKKISDGTVQLKMLNNKQATLSSKDGKVTINKAKIIKADMMAKNGIVHIIDEVLLPPEKNKKTSLKKD